jgi:PadR family transcriptional regulator
VESEWGLSENNRRARYYRLTRKGRRQLETEAAEWRRLSLAITRVMEA